MMPSAASSLARYPAFLKHEANSNQFSSSIQNQSASLSSNSSASSTSSITPPTFDLPNLINDTFLQSEFQRNLAQFTNQLTMTGQNELLSNSTANDLQYSSDEQLINSSNKKLNFSIDSLVNGKSSALNKQAAAALSAFNNNSLNGSTNKKDQLTDTLSTQNLNNISAMVSAAALVFNNRNNNQLQKTLLNKNELRNSISPCSSTSSVLSSCDQKQQQSNSSSQTNNGASQQQPQRTSANNSPRPASAASQHSSSNSASQLLSAANLQNNNLSNNSSSSLTIANNSNKNINKPQIKEERSRSPTTDTTPNRSTTPQSSFLKNESLNASTDNNVLLQQLQQHQLRQLQQLQQAQNCPDAALLQHLQQQQFRQQLQQSNSTANNQNSPLPNNSPTAHLTSQQQNLISPQPTTQQQSTPQPTNGPPNTFNPNTATALLNQIRASSLNSSTNPLNPAALNPLNGLNLPNLTNPGLPVNSNQPPNLPNPLGPLGQLNQAAAAAACATSSLIPSLNPLSPPRPIDYSSYYQYLAMARQNYYLPGNAYMNAFHPFIVGMGRKPKRVRTAFNPNQLLQLEQAFEKNQYVVGQERKQLATSLQLSETQVKVWFQNRRTKHKRLKTEGEDLSKSPLSDNNDKCFSGDEEVDDDDTEIDPDGFNSDELKMQHLINSNFNPFANGFGGLNNLTGLNGLNQNRQAEFLYTQAFAAAAQAANQSNLNRSNSVSNAQSTSLTAQQS